MKVKCNANCKYVKEGYCTLEEIEIEEEETLPDGGWNCSGKVAMPPNCLNFEEADEEEEDGTELRDDIPECLCFKCDCFHNDGTGICTLGYVYSGELYCERYVRTTLL